MNLQITAKQLELRPEIKKYAEQKFGKLERYVPRHARKTVHLELILKEQKGKKSNPFSCEANLTLPGEKVTVEEATVNIFAAIDIVEAKVKNTLRRYKDKHGHKHTNKRQVLERFRRLADRDFWGSQN